MGTMEAQLRVYTAHFSFSSAEHDDREDADVAVALKARTMSRATWEAIRTAKTPDTGNAKKGKWYESLFSNLRTLSNHSFQHPTQSRAVLGADQSRIKTQGMRLRLKESWSNPSIVKPFIKFPGCIAWSTSEVMAEQRDQTWHESLNIALLFVSVLDFRWGDSENPRCCDPASALSRDHRPLLKIALISLRIPGSSASTRWTAQFDPGQVEMFWELTMSVSVEQEYELKWEIYPSVLWNIFPTEYILFRPAAFVETCKYEICKHTNMATSKYGNMEIWNTAKEGIRR
jgi:hypothetical protein